MKIIFVFIQNDYSSCADRGNKYNEQLVSCFVLVTRLSILRSASSILDSRVVSILRAPFYSSRFHLLFPFSVLSWNRPQGRALLSVHPLIRSGEALPRDSYRGCMLKSKTSGANHPLKSFRIDKGRPFRAATADPHRLRNIATEKRVTLINYGSALPFHFYSSFSIFPCD